MRRERQGVRKRETRRDRPEERLERERQNHKETGREKKERIKEERKVKSRIGAGEEGSLCNMSQSA